MYKSRTALIPLEKNTVDRIKQELINSLKENKYLAETWDPETDSYCSGEDQPQTLDENARDEFIRDIPNAVISISVPLEGGRIAVGVDEGAGWVNGPNASDELKEEFKKVVLEGGLIPKALLAAAYFIGQGSHWVKTYVQSQVVWVKGGHDV